MKYPIKILIDCIALILIYKYKWYPRWKTNEKGLFIIKTLMYIYISFVLYFTLMPILSALPFIFDHPYTPMNLHLFVDVWMGRGDFIRQVLLNIILMMPFGFLFPLTLTKKHKFFHTIACVFLFSLTIELLQPLLSGYRIADITDLTTNLMGGIIGYLFYLVFRPLVIKIFKLNNVV